MGKRRKSRSARIKERTRLIDPGPDASGRYSPSPYALQHGHQVETAPKELRSTPDSSFPKRVATQRMIDRYKARSQLTLPQFRAAEFLLAAWDESGLEPKLVAGYDPVTVQGSSTKDALIAKRSGGGSTGWPTLAAVRARL